MTADTNNKMIRLGESALYRVVKEKLMVREVMTTEMIKSVNEYIFDGNPDSENPLEEIRSQFQ